MLIKGDKIKLVKDMQPFSIGDIFEVVNVSDDGVITIKNKYGQGIMSYDIFTKYFEKIQPREWTKWKNIEVQGNVIKYRTNGKRVMVRYGIYVAIANCHPDDVFDLDTGLQLAISRLNYKIAKQVLINTERKLGKLKTV